MKKRVLVAMSGGVDSSVTAALLQEQGYDVEGVTMKLTAGLCCDIGSAQAVCHHLGIMHHMIDAQAEFAQSIVQDLPNIVGCTPNPCIKCNDIIKFHLLLTMPAQTTLTSPLTLRPHCAGSGSIPRFTQKAPTATRPELFFYRLTQEQMQSILPLGEIRK
jgi:tRNA-specific 2-thiouridylase